MLIKYNGVNVHALPYIETDKKKLKANPVSHGPQDVFWLRPGWNEFPSHIWKMHEKHPQILQMLDDKKIELMEIPVVIGGKKTIVGRADEELHLTVLDEKTAIKITKETLNRDMLQRWLDEENRHKVKRELEKQIKPLLPDSQHKTA